jgi:hypothetical protein
MQPDWSDLDLRLIRAAGDSRQCFAGVASLSTKEVFVKRDPPRKEVGEILLSLSIGRCDGAHSFSP